MLNTVPLKHYIDFDVNNKQHCEAALLPLTEGRIHETLRFNVLPGFESVPGMAMTLIALRHLGEEYVEKYKENIMVKEFVLANNSTDDMPFVFSQSSSRRTTTLTSATVQ